MNLTDLKLIIIKKIIRYMVMYHDEPSDAARRLEFTGRIDTAFTILSEMVKECRINDNFKSLTVDGICYTYEVISDRPFRYKMLSTPVDNK